ncbi:DCTN2 [Lepeophtheirus salmonis]|uniref:DCTN2 n=1 Tax=Lepeophtheirus salmonis TaxID=72036 RepID=A0A7R8CT17_LEPSM|nr:DCTN2 [Lepeophtheirus salmonis]CAF2884590.1 DCTN2 [Lepeophtheirus salmonis]
MADPKYANLPGIAHDQPDVFETNDLPEADQYIQETEESCPDENSDSLETLHIDAYESMGKFRGKYVDSGRVDFSDRIRGIGRKGYVVFTCDDTDENTESPMQKYQRLNAEIRELASDLESVSEQGKESKEESCTGLSIKVESLRNDLSSLQIESLLGSSALKSLSDPKDTKERDAVFADLQAAVSSVNKNSANSDTSDGVTYEFYLKPELAKLKEGTELALLEKRVQYLEKILEASPEKMSLLSIETNQKSIVKAISTLSAKTHLLNSSNLNHVEGRLGALQQKLKEITEKNSAIENVEKMSKISELYDLVQKNQSIATSLPGIVDRLEALESLHNEALQFNKALSQLDAVQEKLVASLGNNKKLLEETQSKINNNMGTIQSNFTSVEQRLEKLNK